MRIINISYKKINISHETYEQGYQDMPHPVELLNDVGARVGRELRVQHGSPHTKLFEHQLQLIAPATYRVE